MPERTKASAEAPAAAPGAAAATLALLHAFPVDARMWIPLVDALAGVAAILTPDQRGFGGQPLGAAPPSLDACADDLAALLERRSVDRAVVGGCSMGGYVAMAFLRRHPDRVAGLLLADTKAVADLPEAAANRLRMAREVERTGSTVGALDAVLPALVGPTATGSHPDLVAGVRAMAIDLPPASLAWAQRAMAARPDSTAALAAFAGPALVVVGEEDGLTPPSQAASMASVLPDAELVVVPGAGHLAALERPEAVAAGVRRLIDRVRTS